MKKKLVKNAFANLSRGGASAVVALVLPPILVRHMGAAEYGVWVLVLQLAAYLSYLDVGLQAAIGRYIAYARERNDTESRGGIFSTAFAGLSIASAIGLVLLTVATVLAPRFFTSVPTALIPAMRVAMALVGASIAVGLPASAWNGVFVGLQRYDIPAITVGSAKLLSAIGLIVAAFAGKSLVMMALIVAGTNLLSYAAQYAMLRRIEPEIHFRWHKVTREMARELWSYCFSLSVWSFGMLLVSGFDLVLVGKFDFKSVAPYAVSATLISFLAGLQNAVFGVIMPHAAEMHAREEADGLGRLLISTTRLGLLLLLITGLPLTVLSGPIIRAWIGAQFVAVGSPILKLLIVANVLRLVGAPFSSILVGTGQQRLIITSPLAEGVVNLGASLLLGWKFGAIGVAMGTFIGSVIGITAQIFYNIPKTRQWISVSSVAFARDGLVMPCVCASPVLFSMLLKLAGVPHVDVAVLPSLCLSIVLCLVYLWLLIKRQGGVRLA